MARPREFDQDKALEEAMHVFWEKGFEAASLSDLTARMGIQRPSLYSAFGDKKGLFEAALRKYTSSHAAYVRGSLHKHSSVKEAFRSFLKMWCPKNMRKARARGASALIQWWSWLPMMKSLRF